MELRAEIDTLVPGDVFEKEVACRQLKKGWFETP